MATSQQRTRAQIRQSVGQLTGQIWMDAGLTSAPTEEAQSAAQLIDTALAFGSENDHRGKWIWASDSAGTLTQRRVLSSSPAERSLTFSVPFGTTPDSNWTYELWRPEVSPTLVHEFIDQSITEADRKGAVSLTSDSIHTGGGVRSWGLSSTIAGITQLEWASNPGEQFRSFDDAMSAVLNASVALSSKDVKEGTASNVVNITSGASAPGVVFAQDSYAAVDLQGYTHMDLWMKSNVNLNSSNLVIKLLDGGTEVEAFLVPALNADSWTRLSFPLTAAESDTGITKFQLVQGGGTFSSATVFIDDAVVYRARSESWIDIPRTYWSIDSDRRELQLEREANVPYAKLQITGVQKPSLLTTDASISQIDPQYVVNSATAKVFRFLGEHDQADRYEALAQQQRVRMTTPSGIKWVDD